MKQRAVFQRVMVTILFFLFFVGCSTFLPRDTTTLAPVDSSETLKPTNSNSLIQSITPSLRPTRTATPKPEWITNFAEPILTAIADRPPDCQEDFSQVGPNWYLEKTNCPNNGCVISEGVLAIAAFPVDNKEAWASQPLPCNSVIKTFVLRVDVNTAKLLRENAANIAYTDTMQVKGRKTTLFEYGFELKNRRRWFSLIGPSGNYGGSYGQLSLSIPPQITFTLISRGSKFAVYLNDVPVTSGEYTGGQGQSEFGLQAWSDGKSIARVEYDNFKVWNLDDIPNLP